MFDPTEEVAISGLHAQILANLRVLKPESKDPAIATCHTAKKWTAVVFADKGQPIYSTLGYEEKNVVGALRKLLELTAGAIGEKLNVQKWSGAS